MRPVLVLSRPLPGLDPAELLSEFEVRTLPPGADREELLAGVAEAQVVILSYLDAVDEAFLSAARRLRHVASYGVGVNHIDLEACRRRGVIVTNTPGVLTDATADHAMALLLAAGRRVAEGDRIVRAGGWTQVDPGFLLGAHVTGKVLGIVGFGRIGQALARRAAGFQMRILYSAPREVAFWGAQRVSLPELLAGSDFVSLNVPLTPATENLLSRERIALMRPGAILVNTARGEVVDDDALADALRAGQVAAAGLDVFRGEPRVPARYLELSNVVLTPHIGSGSAETRAAMSRLVADDVLRVVRGEAPRHPV
ncbi:MAG TPA: D-glycerate dehydrogenase [Anaeromyxobacter sp.]|nr:D-glycerate dehydrogenase [Anaeromyxobacter sp.]